MATKKTAAQAVKAAVKKAARKTPKKRSQNSGMTKAAVKQREDIFIEAYLANGRNGKAAAITAGFAPGSAHVEQNRLLNRPHVAEAIAAREKELLDKHGLKAEEVVASIARALRFDPRKLFNEDGSSKAVHELDEDTARALSSFELIGVKGKKAPAIKKFKAVDQGSAREQGMKYFGLNERDNKQRTDPIKQLLDEIGSRGRGLPVKP